MLSLLHDPVQITCHIWLIGLSVSFKMEQFCLSPLFFVFYHIFKEYRSVILCNDTQFGFLSGFLDLWFDQVYRSQRCSVLWAAQDVRLTHAVMVSLVTWLRHCCWDFSTGKSLFFPSVILWLISILGGKILAWSPFPHQTQDSIK